MNYKLNSALGLPLVTAKTIRESVGEQGLHTPSTGLTNPFDDKLPYDKQFFPRQSPIPDMSLQGYGETIGGRRIQKPFKESPEGSWTLPNTFANDYRVKQSNYKALKGLKTNEDKFSNALSPADQATAAEMFKEPEKQEVDNIIPPRDNSMPDYQVEQLERAERESNGFFGMDKTRLLLGALGLVVVVGAYSMFKNK